MDRDYKNVVSADTGDVTTLRDYLAITACLFGAFFFSMLVAAGLVAAAQIFLFNVACTLDGSCNPREFPNFSDTQLFVFALTGGGTATAVSLLTLPLCALGGLASLRFRLHPSLGRNLYTACGFLCAALYGALLYLSVGAHAGEYRLGICGIAVPLAGAAACWGVYPMLRKHHIPNVFADE